MDLFLGLDLGTSNLKALVMTDTGAIVARGASSYPLLRPQPGWAVQHPGAWWAALVEVLADLRARAVPLGRVAAGVSFFGKNGDGANTVGVQADPATQRAVSLDFAVDTSRPMTLDQAKAFVRTVVPTDASDLSLGAPPQGNPWRLGSCSPALAAVFSGQNANNTYGRLAAAYYQGAHGVYRITIMPIIIG